MVFNLIKEDKEEKIKDIEKKMKKGIWMIRYYADWCGHCQMMDSDWKKFEENNKKGNIISFESEAIKKMSHQPENFKGFPTIMILKNNKKMKEFDQERIFKNFQQFYYSFIKKKPSQKNKSNIKKLKSTLKKIRKKSSIQKL